MFIKGMMTMLLLLMMMMMMMTMIMMIMIMKHAPSLEVWVQSWWCVILALDFCGFFHIVETLLNEVMRMKFDA